jgi:hypothetical protein
MKTIKRKVLVVVFMLVTLFNYANNDNDFNNTINAKKVKVAFKNVKKGHLLTIKDENGTQLHSETISRTGLLTKVFDLSSLGNGKYTVELNKDYEIIVKTLEVKNNKVIFNKDSKKIIFKPVIRNEENILMISKIAFDKKPMKVNLYFNGKAIYSETEKNEEILNRVYKFDKEVKGDYRVIIYNNNRRYVHDFKI